MVSNQITPQQYATHKQEMKEFREQQSGYLDTEVFEKTSDFSVEVTSKPLFLYYDGPSFTPEAVR